MSFFEQNQAVGQFINEVSQNLGVPSNLILMILVGILLWSAVWTLLGMWKSARKGSWIWFIVFALTNTVGILPILYIYVFSKTDWSKFVRIKVRRPKSSKKKLKKAVKKKAKVKVKRKKKR